jgi:hypothetical protein
MTFLFCEDSSRLQKSAKVVIPVKTGMTVNGFYGVV